MPAKRLVVAPSAASTPEERVAAIKQRILDKLFCTQGKFPRVAAPYDYYQALSYTVRDRLLYHWIHSAQTYFENNSRTVVCLSAEYLPGPHLANNLLNLGMHDDVETAVRELGHSLDDWLAVEEEPGLGNGGLGRLAACFIAPWRWVGNLFAPVALFSYHSQFSLLLADHCKFLARMDLVDQGLLAGGHQRRQS